MSLWACRIPIFKEYSKKAGYELNKSNHDAGSIFLTPQGALEKSRLSLSYMHRSLESFRELKSKGDKHLQSLSNKGGESNTPVVIKISLKCHKPMNTIKCYLCNTTSFTTRKGQVRDAPDLKILECADCGLVTLSSLEHIQFGLYENSGMHGVEPTPMDAWLKDTDWDDQRRFDMVKTLLPNKHLLDFGCGAGGFLNKARQLAKSVAGIELELRVQKHWHEQITIHPNLESVEGGATI